MSSTPVFEGQTNAETTAQTSPSQQPGERRLREGTELLDQPGRFEVVGDRVVFVAKGSPVRATALENLALERVTRMIADDPARSQWRVTGKITEYRGRNFLLIQRAVLRMGGENRNNPLDGVPNGNSVAE